jgi:site-specific recombinase XerC
MRGHIRERSLGRWAIVIDARGEDGKRRRRWHSFAGNKRQAQIRCAELIAEAQSGGAVDPTRVTVAAFLDRFLEDWAPLHLTAGSTKRYREALVHVRRHLGDRRLQTLRPVDISGLYAAMVRHGLNPRTVGLVHSVLHRALGQAKVWGVIGNNPADVVKPPKVVDRETNCLQPDAARELLKKLAGHPLYIIASLLEYRHEAQ